MLVRSRTAGAVVRAGPIAPAVLSHWHRSVRSDWTIDEETAMRRRLLAAAMTAALLATACGGNDDEAEAGAGSTEEDAETPAPTGVGFCDGLETVATDSNRVFNGLAGEDPSELAAVVESALARYEENIAAMEAGAPEEIADDVSVMAAAMGQMFDAMQGLDPSDPAAFADVVDPEVFGPEMQAAGGRIADYAREQCGFDPDELGRDDDLVTDAAEPPDPCTFVDPTVAATAAGLDVDVADGDGSGDIDLGSYHTRSCSYANGQLVISTFTFATGIDALRADFVRNAERNGGEVLVADLGGLPSSTLIAEVMGVRTVTVFEAPTPFSVGAGDDVAPEALVAAAQAVAAATS
jgi:hypothetical protein